jgi:hypothetical protein
MDSQNNGNINEPNNTTGVPTTGTNSTNIENGRDVLRVSEPTILGPKEPERRKKRGPLLLIILLIIIGTVIGAIYVITSIINKQDNTNKNEEVKEEVPVDTNTKIIFGNEVTVNGTGAAVEGNNVTITKEGTYEISGNTTDGSITVNTPSKEVTLILTGTNIKCTSGAAIKVLDASALTITLKDGTENYLEDGGTSEYTAAIFSKSAIIINGTGSLEVKGNVKKGISIENNDITINSGKMKITSLEDGINAGGIVTINQGNIYINSATCGINSASNITVNNGEVYVIGGNSAVNAGINSEGIYQINGGTIIGLASNITILPDEDSSQKTMMFNLNSATATEDIFALTDNQGQEVISFAINKGIKTIIVSSPDLKNATYNLYSGVKHASMTGYGIYPKGEMTLGTKITIDNTSDFNVSMTNNWFGSSSK